MVGEKLRQARLAQQLSLREVAEGAEISVATLSRIETGKQNLELNLFLTLSRILRLTAHELLGDGDGSDDGIDPMVGRIAALGTAERLRLWRDLAEVSRVQRSERKVRNRNTALVVEELLAQIDFIRAEIEAVRKNLKP